MLKRLKQKKRTLILSSLLTLSPVLIGLLLWNRLPERMTTHWGADGVADGWSGRPFAVFGLPLILLAVHWLCAIVTTIDPKSKNQSSKVFELVLWIIPVVSLFTSGLVYLTAFDLGFGPELLTFPLIGVMFIIIGNYLPKCRQNYTTGIKIKWTLENEENWNATHRMAGKLWVGVGFASLLCTLLPLSAQPVAMVVLIAVAVVIPVIYSRNYYKKQLACGQYTASSHPMSERHKKLRKISLPILAVLLIAVGVLMFSGDIDVVYEETSFTIEASYWNDLTVEYDAIDSVEYHETFRPGVRTYGFGSARLSLGTFKNEQFGSYTLYSYTGSDSCVVLHVEGKILAIAGDSDESTRAIFDAISAKIG